MRIVLPCLMLCLTSACDISEREADVGSVSDLASGVASDASVETSPTPDTVPGGDTDAEVGVPADAGEDSPGDPLCEPVCDERECGGDGCGGECGVCGDRQVCVDGYCAPECSPTCDELECGDDGCGGSCGTCLEGDECLSGICECTRSCDGLECGDDGCGGTCGTCAPDQGCASGVCVDDCRVDCEGLECGDDGCGGSCGECETDCLDGTCIDATRCPPVAPFGVSEGETLRDYTLLTCDGEEVTLHELCGNEVNLVIGYAGWCPTCSRNAVEWASGYAARADDSLGVYFVITETASFEFVDSAYCAGVRDRYGLTMPVLYDPSGEFFDTLVIAPNDSTILVDANFEVVDSGQYRAPSSVWADVDGLLSR